MRKTFECIKCGFPVHFARQFVIDNADKPLPFLTHLDIRCEQFQSIEFAVVP